MFWGVTLHVEPCLQPRDPEPWILTLDPPTFSHAQGAEAVKRALSLEFGVPLMRPAAPPDGQGGTTAAADARLFEVHSAAVALLRHSDAMPDSRRRWALWACLGFCGQLFPLTWRKGKVGGAPP
jgi:hypothetical protein